jgi:hypothetical protein
MESCQITADFHHTLTTNLTQHDVHGPVDNTKIIHYHHLANQFHAHPYCHLLTCLDDDNGWFWGYHLAHVRHAGSDLWSGLDENQM